MKPSISRPFGHTGARLWLLVIAALCAYLVICFATAPRFYSDITELLPEASLRPELRSIDLALQRQYDRQFSVLLRSDSDAHSQQLAAELKRELLASSSVEDPADSGIYLKLGQLYRPYINRLLNRETRQWLTQSSAEQIAEQAAQSLFNPSARARPWAFAEDPFNLGGRYLHSLQPLDNIEIKNGWPSIDAARGRWYLINLTLSDSAFSIDVQRSVLDTLENFQQKPRELKFELLRSGLIFHAAAGAQLAKREISSVGIASLLAIIALVWTVFRSPQPLFGVLLALGGGLLSALAISLAVFGQIHLLTLAFGSTLLGVAVDYCFHFMLNSHKLGCSRKSRRKLAPALATSALTSIAAYLIQLATPFPGLQQMAVFCAAGLAGTWLSVVALGPSYQPRPSANIERLSHLFETRLLPLYRRVRGSDRLYMGATCGLFLLVALTLHNNIGPSDIRSLNTSGPELLAESARVQQLLKPTSVSRYLLVSADSEQQLLERLETLDDALEPLRLRQLLHSSDSLAHWIPSLKRQLDNQRLVLEKLDNKARILLCERLNMSQCQLHYRTDTPELRSENLSGIAEIEALRPVKQSGQLFAPLLLNLNPLATDDDLIAIAADYPWASFSNRTDDLSDQLDYYRTAAALYLAIALLLISASLLYRYKMCGLRILLPMVLSALAGLALAAWSNGMTVFHLLAVLLVVGIALDTGIFYREVGLNGDSWLAASLSSLTSLLAFGMLATSQVPVLHQFGLVVLAGILCNWLLTPLFFSREDLPCNRP